jgi:hypothetical protein
MENKSIRISLKLTEAFALRGILLDVLRSDLLHIVKDGQEKENASISVINKLSK